MSVKTAVVPSTTVIPQPPWVDSCGNIRLNGRTAMLMVITFQDGQGNAVDVSRSLFTFEVQDVFKLDLEPVDGQSSQQALTVPQTLVAQVGVTPNPKVGPFFVLRDETQGEADAIVKWEGMFIVRAYTDEPAALAPSP